MFAAVACLNLDDAWPIDRIPLPVHDLREWGPRLRFCAPGREIEAFYREMQPHLAHFTLFGSGDFHHLSALWLRKLQEPFALVSFDNHPDWDIRPPRWCCGTWINRAFELPNLRRAAVWGPASFECWRPWTVFANRKEISAGRLEAFPWVHHRPEGKRNHPGAITRTDWRERFDRFAESLADLPVYVTVDMDCLCAEDAVTNWEPGMFRAGDVAWAVRRLRETTRIVGGDLCGAWSAPRYHRWTQKFCGTIDHPKIPPPPLNRTEKNLQVFSTIWPALAGPAEDSAADRETPTLKIAS